MHIGNLGICFACLTSGCTTSIITSDGADAQGLRYYLPQSMLVLNTIKTISTNSSLIFDSNKDIDISKWKQGTAFSDGLDQCFPVKRIREYGVNIDHFDIMVVPDQEKVYSIQVDPAVFMGGTLSIGRSDSGILKNITFDTQGQADEAIVAGVKTVASIAGTFAGFNSVDLPTLPTTRAAPPSSRAQQGAKVQKSLVDDLKTGKIEKVTCQTWLMDVLEEIGIDPSSDLKPLQFYTLLSDPESVKSLKAVGPEAATIAKIESDIRLLEFQVKDSDGALFLQLRNKINLLQQQLSRAKSRHASYVADYENRQAIFEKKLRLGSDQKSRSSQGIFHVSQIPTFNDLGESISLFSGLGAAITLDTIGSAKAESPSLGDGEAYIAYRDNSPYLLRIFTLPHPADTSKQPADWKEHKKILVNLFSDTAPIGKVAYKQSSFGDRKLEIKFSESGALLSVDLKFSSSGSASSDAALSSSQGALAEYKASLSTVYEISAAKRTEQLSALQAKIDQTTKHKEILEAQQSLAGAVGSIENALDLQELNHKLDALKLEKQILTESSAVSELGATLAQSEQIAVLEAQLALERAQAALKPESDENSEIKTLIETLKLRIELLEKQQQLKNFEVP